MEDNDVDIILENGQLGLTEGTADGLSALIYSGVAVVDKIALAEPKQIFSTDGAKALGLDEAYDTANSTKVWKNIKDFYAQAGEGAALWVMLYDSTTVMADVMDKANDLAKKCLDAGNGLIRLLAIGRVPDGAYVPTYDDGLDDDVTAAILKAHELAEEFASQYKPLRVIIDGRDYQGVSADLIDLKGNSTNRVSMLMSTDEAGSLNASIGLLLGRFARDPVQRNPGRVKSGAVSITESYLTDGVTDVNTFDKNGERIQIQNKGVILLRKRQGKNGYYFSDDPTASPTSDDYSSFARGRVIDKAMVITYDTYVEEILDDLEVDEDGFLSPAVVKSYQSKIDNALALGFGDEVSSTRSTLDPRQNLLSAEKVKIGLKIIPKGYSKVIEVTLGFENPALT